MNRRFFLTVTEAAVACNVSRDTIKRRLGAGLFPGACRESGGAWRIPVSDLVAAGLTPHITAGRRVAVELAHRPNIAPSRRPGPEVTPDLELTERVVRLEAQVNSIWLALSAASDSRAPALVLDLDAPTVTHLHDGRRA